MSGFFTESRAPGMLEAIDEDHINSASTDFGRVVYAFYGNYSDAFVKVVFTKYAEFVRFIKNRDLQTGWIKAELGQLRREFHLF